MLNSNLATVENTKLLSNVSVLSIKKNGRYYIAGALDLPSGVNVFGYLDVHNYDDSGVNKKITWTPVNSNITYINIKNDTWLGWDSFALNSSMPVWALNNHELGFSLDANNKELGVWVDGVLFGNISFK